ncbi:MAG: hypothetical protein Q8920_08075 [Bacillota bacterium]|nr:hypothetical protein [Bacillota bacterium]
MLKKLQVFLFLAITVFIILTGNIYADNPDTGNKLYVNYSSSRLLISSKYGSHYLWMEFSSCGPNGLFSLSGLYLSKYFVPDMSVKYAVITKSSSDWTGPISMLDNDYKDTGIYGFTGGWHNVTVGKSLVPTAYTKYCNVYINSTAIKFGYKGSCDSVVIKVANLIKAANTVIPRKDSLYQHEEYKITPCKIEVNTELTALDNLTVKRYYGLQSINNYWKGLVSYNTGKASLKRSTVYSDSGPKSADPDVSRITIFSSNGSEYLQMGLDRSYGLGKMQYVASSIPCGFTESYGKSYFSLVYGMDLNMKKNETMGWKGYYKFGCI